MGAELRRLRIFFSIVAVFALAVTIALPSIVNATKENRPAFSFPVTTWQETTFAGIPFYIQYEKDYVDQWFELRVRRGNQYLPLIGTGYLQAYNIVWIFWEDSPQGFRTRTHDTLTFELYTKGSDKIRIKNVSLLADGMFDWLDNTPINPPQE